jgi:hypothetical protein
MQTTRDELMLKRDRLEDLQSKEEELAYRLAGSQGSREADVKAFYRSKRFFIKQKMMRKTQTDVSNSRITIARQEV